MGASRAAAGGLLGFLADVQARGAREALDALDLGGLAGRPVDQVFLALMECICPAGGTVDEGIARDAFVETIADLAEIGVSNLDALTAAQMESVFELFVTHTVEVRIINDIGTRAVVLPGDIHAAMRVQTQLYEFIRRAVGDAIEAARVALSALTSDTVNAVVNDIYGVAFGLLQAFGEAEAAT